MKAYTKKSHVRESANDKIFGFVISLILILFAVITAIPLISEAAVSLSSKTASQMNQINLLPVGFTFDSWKYLFMKGKIWMPFLISVSSTVLGVAIALLLNVLMAYPLSKTEFRPSKYIMLFENTYGSALSSYLFYGRKTTGFLSCNTCSHAVGAD